MNTRLNSTWVIHSSSEFAIMLVPTKSMTLPTYMAVGLDHVQRLGRRIPETDT